MKYTIENFRLSDRPASRLTAMSKETTQSRLDGKASAADIVSVIRVGC